jgi:hypothetical protein
MEPVIKKRLPATGLFLWKRDAATKVFQDFRDRHANVGIELIGQARDEDRHMIHAVSFR